jgi:hypothetical protein
VGVSAAEHHQSPYVERKHPSGTSLKPTTGREHRPSGTFSQDPQVPAHPRTPRPLRFLATGKRHWSHERMNPAGSVTVSIQ